jgi:hypothetical protein
MASYPVSSGMLLLGRHAVSADLRPYALAPIVGKVAVMSELGEEILCLMAVAREAPIHLSGADDREAGTRHY